MLLLGLGVIYPQETSAEAFTGETFLTWSESQQRSYLNAQLVMASTIVAREKPTMSQCVSDEFFGSSGMTSAAFADAMRSIHDFKTYHPSSVLVILIENACGEFY